MAKQIKMIAYVMYTPDMKLYDANIHTLEDAATADMTSLNNGEYHIDELGYLTFTYEIVYTDEG